MSREVKPLHETVWRPIWWIILLYVVVVAIFVGLGWWL